MGNILRHFLGLAVAIFGLTCVLPAYSETYQQRDASLLAKRCAIEKNQKGVYDCSAYIYAVIDTYFLYNQSCQVSPNTLLPLQVKQSVENVLSAMGQADLKKQSAALLVWQTVAKINPCQVQTNTAAQDKSLCIPLF